MDVNPIPKRPAISGCQIITDPSLHESFLNPLDVICKATCRTYLARLKFLVTPHCIIYKESFQFGINASGSLPPTFYSFCIPLTLTGEAYFGNQEFSYDTVACSQGGALHTVIPSGQQHISVLVSRQILHSNLNEENAQSLNKCADKLQIECPKSEIHSFGQWLNRILNLDTVWSASNPQKALLQLEQDLICRLARLLEQTLQDPESRSLGRITGLNRAMEWLHNTDSTTITVHDLYKAASVSQRTLERAFSDYFQQSARGFLLQRKLHMVRKVLLEADSRKVLVKEVAIEHGFYDLGRFAQYYKACFFESPNQTLSSRHAAPSRQDKFSLYSLMGQYT